MADVTYQREEYKYALDGWIKLDDVCDGEEAVKAQRESYLPKPNPDDHSQENRTRYNQYISRAVFYNATGRTLKSLVGSAFCKVPVLSVPIGLEYVEDDINGEGISIYQQSQKTLAETLKKGRAALLADYPVVESPASRLQKASIRATLSLIHAEQITNWRIELVGGSYQFTLVVIKECTDEITQDGFGLEKIDQYRVLKLVDGQYLIEIWRNPDAREWVLHEVLMPLDGSGRRWSLIPFMFVGSSNNDSHVDGSPMIDLANLNLAHYRNSADYEDSAFFCGQPQPWISGLDENWRDWLQEKGIYVGSRNPILLPENGQFGIAQSEPNTLVKEAMDQKERQMASLGARLIERGAVTKTRIEAADEHEVEHSVLSLAASNVSEAYTAALQWLGMFENVTGEMSYEITQDFIEHNLDSAMLRELVAAWQAGTLPRSDLNNQYRKTGLIDTEKTDEEILEEIEADGAGLGLSNGDQPDIE